MVSIKQRFLFIVSLLLLSGSLAAQWSINGVVIDASSGEGLSYVNIVVQDTTLGTTSDHKGHFKLGGLINDKYGITLSMIGFQTLRLENISPESGPLFIELHPEIYLTDEVVVSASRKSQSLSLAPASVAIINQNQLRESNPRSFDEAFHGVNGIQVTRSSGSNVQALSIRGASEVAGGGIGNRVLLLLDGRPAITPESGGALWNLVPLGAIERIEVIKGAYSSLFGSSAMGGIINVITRTPDSIAKTDVRINYGFYDQAPDYAEYKSYNDFFGVDFTRSMKEGRWSYAVNAAYKSDDGHREQSSFRTYNIFGKFKYDFSANRSLQFSAMYNDIFNDTPATWYSFTRPHHVAEYRKDDTQHRREWNADLHYLAFAHAHIKYSSRFYYYSGLSDYIFNDDPLNDSTNVNTGRQFVAEERVYVSRLGNATQIDFSLDDHNYLIAGIELQGDYIDGRPDTVLYGKHKAWNIGAFIQDQISMGDHWIVTAGIRYDQYKIIHTFTEANVSPKIAAVFQPNKNLAVRALLARAFRNPSISERFTKFEQGGGLSFRPNPTLRSEKLTLSAEVGSKINLGMKWKLDGSLFYNHYKDLISYQQRSLPGEDLAFEVINLNKAIMQGFELSIEHMPARWLKLLAGYTYLDARDASDNRVNDVLPYKSRHTGYVSLLGSYKKWQLYFQARGRSNIHEVFIYPGSEPEGYIILNGKLSYSFSNQFSAFITLNNITDQQYEEIERYRMEGRNYNFGLNYSF